MISAPRSLVQAKPASAFGVPTKYSGNCCLATILACNVPKAIAAAEAQGNPVFAQLAIAACAVSIAIFINLSFFSASNSFLATFLFSAL